MDVDMARAMTGLTGAEALTRLADDGPNVIPITPAVPPWRELVGQMLHFFALMLWFAAALAFVAKLPQLGVAIIVVVIFNGLFAFVQEYRAERAAERIRDLLPRRVMVIRDGERIEINGDDLVRGDLVALSAGDRISADLRVATSHGLRLDTSTLTGESEPLPADVGDVVFAGTFVVEGEAFALVEATGTRTRLAGITELTRATKRPPTPLAIELHRVVRTIASVAVGVGVTFFVLSALLGTDPAEGFVLAIGVTVALVPEGLLPTVTLSLALGAQRMAHRHALIRRLEAVETLGSTTFICTDKTGTLTQNRMAVVDVWTPAGIATIHGNGYDPNGIVEVGTDAAKAAVGRLAIVAAACSDGHAAMRDGEWVSIGDPMETAIDVLARRLGVIEEVRRLSTASRRFPFDPRRRRMSMVVDGRVLVKGAPDQVVDRCRNGGGAMDVVHALAERGLRVLAVAERTLPDGAEPADAEKAETDLTLLGLLGLEDPPRPDVDRDIIACRKSGLRVAMITGDHPHTAAAIAREVGLLLPGARVITGDDLPEDDEMLGALVDHDGIVLARISPEQKLRIARALRSRGHVVAMTGDGVNDGPALQEADIGIAMGASGTDVAREAADLVLLDDNFSTIVEAIRQGRAAFLNVRRFLTYHLTDNVAELTPFLVWALSGGRFPLAIGVLQVLALDIGTDTLSAVALGAEAPTPGVLDRSPARGHLLNATVAKRAFAIMGPIEAALGMLAFVASLLASGWRPGTPFPTGTALTTASGAAFLTIVTAQTMNAFACRSTSRPPWALGWLSNRMLVVGSTIELVLTALFLTVPVVALAMRHRLPSSTGWLIAIVAPVVVLLVDAGVKRFGLLNGRARRSVARPERPVTATDGNPARSGYPRDRHP
jgi:calcium-translocating P-type ATPase